jgi:hypothetical protein
MTCRQVKRQVKRQVSHQRESGSMINDDVKPRILRPVPDPLGLYFRPGPNDHTSLGERIANGGTAFSGLVISAGRMPRHEELRAEARAHNLEAVLDPHTVELATAGGFARSTFDTVAWKGQAIHTAASLNRGVGMELAADIAACCVTHKFDAVLAPTHFLSEGPGDPWLPIDVKLTSALRQQLDAAGSGDTRIYYPLVISQKVFRDRAHRASLISALADVPVDAIWLRVHPFGSDCTGVALKGYIEACLDLQRIGLPLVAERTGTVGLPLLAFNAVGGIECGVTFGERFDMQALIKPMDGSGFMPPPRVYVDRLGIFLDRKQATAFFGARGIKAFFACQDATCCRDGSNSTMDDPRRHFLNSRMKEVARLAAVPSAIRSGHYLEEHLRPASDLVLKATRVEADFDFGKQKQRLEQWRETLGVMHLEGVGRSSTVLLPRGRRVVRARSASL